MSFSKFLGHIKLWRMDSLRWRMLRDTEAFLNQRRPREEPAWPSRNDPHKDARPKAPARLKAAEGDAADGSLADTVEASSIY